VIGRSVVAGQSLSPRPNPSHRRAAAPVGPWTVVSPVIRQHAHTSTLLLPRIDDHARSGTSHRHSGGRAGSPPFGSMR
jgi:hypothetical protein